MSDTSSVKRKCACCNKKLSSLVSFPCKCGEYYCAQHRYDTEHNCSYDYKADFTKLSSTILVKVEAKKIEVI